MLDAAGGPSGVLVLRVWTERGGRLRVRISTSSRPGSKDVVTTYAATADEVIAHVQAWFDSFDASP